MRVLVVLLALLLAGPVWGQALPDALRSSRLTQAQENELNGRLSALQGRLRSLAGETQLRESAVRNIAIEIFGARPGLDFETYAALIDSGARELRTYLTEARGRTDADPALAELRAQAIAAAEAGQLTEARLLYDQLVARSRETLEARWAREDRARAAERRTQTLAVAADMSESARLAYVAGDYVDAARRYGEAAVLAPEGARERWQYTFWQALALVKRGSLFGEPGPLQEAVLVYERALALAPVTRVPADWAATQNYLGSALRTLGQRGDDVALARAVAAYEAALTVRTQTGDPLGWAVTQTSLGGALLMLGERGDDAALARAVAAHEAALTVATRERYPENWAAAQTGLGNALSALGDRGDNVALARAVSAYDSALTVLTRERDAQGWALTQMNLGTALRTLGERGDDLALTRAVVAYEAALTIRTRERDPDGWAATQMNLGNAFQTLGRRGDDAALARAVSAYEAALTIRTRERNPQGWATAQFNLALAHRAAHHPVDALAAARAALSGFEQIGHGVYTQNARQLIAELETQR